MRPPAEIEKATARNCERKVPCKVLALQQPILFVRQALPPLASRLVCSAVDVATHLILDADGQLFRCSRSGFFVVRHDASEYYQPRS